VTDEQLSGLYTTLDRRILSDDIDRLLSDKETQIPPSAPTPAVSTRTRSKVATPVTAKPVSKGSITSPVAFEDIALPTAQRTLIYRLQTATQAIIPATLELLIPWKPVEDTRESLRESGVECSQFLVFAWCVALASRNHPAFRSALLNDSTMRRYAHLHMGIAVARPGDELLIARVADSDTLSLTGFVAAAQGAIGRAREGKDQASNDIQISLTNMASTGARFGIPVVAAPAVSTLFIGAPWDEAYPIEGGGIGFRRLASMVMTFDHRMANGIGAANFMNEIVHTLERLPELTRQ
jgi:pyruvate dehydrogenase E2 component (dihydrolipoamide acetyltransferase)